MIDQRKQKGIQETLNRRLSKLLFSKRIEVISLQNIVIMCYFKNFKVQKEPVEIEKCAENNFHVKLKYWAFYQDGAKSKEGNPHPSQNKSKSFEGKERITERHPLQKKKKKKIYASLTFWRPKTLKFQSQSR